MSTAGAASRGIAAAKETCSAPIRKNIACQANFAATLLTSSSHTLILIVLLVPVHREQISEMNAERCGR